MFPSQKGTGSRIRIRNNELTKGFSIFIQKVLLSSRKYDPGCLSWISDPDFFPSRIQGSKKHWIPDPDPQHWFRKIKASPVQKVNSFGGVNPLSRELEVPLWSLETHNKGVKKIWFAVFTSHFQLNLVLEKPRFIPDQDASTKKAVLLKKWFWIRKEFNTVPYIAELYIF